MLKRYIGDRAFYRRAMAIALPIIIQNAITNLVSLLDNVMVGHVGTLQMSGVSIINQLIFIFNLSIFGANAGAGIFTAQFHGNADTKGVQYTLRYKLILCTLLVLGWGAVMTFLDTPLIELYLQGEGNAADAASGCCLIGDLTLLRDINAAAILPQLPPGKRIVAVLNNEGAAASLRDTAGDPELERLLVQPQPFRMQEIARLWGAEYYPIRNEADFEVLDTLDDDAFVLLELLPDGSLN